nr:hypothetical protein StreXyl84_71660 [Streptomyces sp. Xyl84]
MADVGCGLGHSTVLMAKAFPRSRLRGFDFHEPSVAAARMLAESEGVGDRVTFEVAGAHEGIAAEAGLRSWRLAVETPTNRVYDVKR